MTITGGKADLRRLHLRGVLLAAALAMAACGAPDPLISYLDDESGLSLNRPPRWTIGAAEQDVDPFLVALHRRRRSPRPGPRDR